MIYFYFYFKNKISLEYTYTQTYVCLYICECVCIIYTHTCILAQLLCHSQFFATPWTVAHQSPLSIFQAGILDWVAISSSSGSSQPKD